MLACLVFVRLSVCLSAWVSLCLSSCLFRRAVAVTSLWGSLYLPMAMHAEQRAQHAYRVCEPRSRLYHRGKPIRYALTALTTRAVRPASVARARRLASSSREPAAASCSPRASSPPSSNAVARGRDSPAPRAEPRADLSSALARQRVACAVEGAVILLCRERGDIGHAGTTRSPRRC